VVTTWIQADIVGSVINSEPNGPN